MLIISQLSFKYFFYGRSVQSCSSIANLLSLAPVCSNTPVCKFLVILKSLLSWLVRVCLIRFRAELCKIVAIQEQDCFPAVVNLTVIDLLGDCHNLYLTAAHALGPYTV